MKHLIPRIPKNYDGPKNTLRSMNDMLPSILKKLGSLVEEKGDLILAAWPKIIGEQFAPMTRACSFQEGVLHVLVKNSTLYSLLSGQDKPKLLHALRAQFPNTHIKNIYFRIG